MSVTASVPLTKDRTIPALETWRPPAGTTVVSADDHVQEPDEFWTDYLPTTLPPAFRDRAPRIQDGQLVVGGVVQNPVVGGDIRGSEEARAFQKNLGRILERFQMNRTGGVATDLEYRLRDMDAENIDASFIFPQGMMGLFGIEDRELMFHCFDVYNQWLAEWCSKAPDRLFGIAVLPTVFAPERTRDYLVRLKQLDYRAIQLPMAVTDVAYNMPDMEPMWDAIEESGMPVSFHTAETPRGYSGPGAMGTFVVMSQAGSMLKLWSLLTFSGVLERHPDMKVIFTEGGLGWIPFALWSADKLYIEFQNAMEPRLGELPSYYWHRQCYASFMRDPRGLEQIEHIGVDKVLWSVDYPHQESVFGSSQSLMKSFHEQLGSSAAAAIIGGNAVRLYHLDDGVLDSDAG